MTTNWSSFVYTSCKNAMVSSGSAFGSVTGTRVPVLREKLKINP